MRNVSSQRVDQEHAQIRVGAIGSALADSARMREAQLLIFVVAATAFTGCTSGAPTGASEEHATAFAGSNEGSSTSTKGGASAADPKSANASTEGNTDKPAAPDDADAAEPELNIDPSPTTHPEVVYVLMTSARGYGFCTGTLVAKDRVVTAGHCLQPLFNSWTVVAPNAPGAPRVRVSRLEMYDSGWAEPAHPDLGC